MDGMHSMDMGLQKGQTSYPPDDNGQAAGSTYLACSASNSKASSDFFAAVSHHPTALCSLRKSYYSSSTCWNIKKILYHPSHDVKNDHRLSVVVLW